MEVVNFTQMKDGTREEYQFLDKLYWHSTSEVPQRLLQLLRDHGAGVEGYQIDRLTHARQSATRAYNDGRDDEYVVACLFHDIGDYYAPTNHSAFAAAVLRPYISRSMYDIILHHGLFQSYYYAHHFDQDRNMRDMHRDKPFYQDTIDFCEHYDQNCFDPKFATKPLEFFVPAVERIMQKPQDFK